MSELLERLRATYPGVEIIRDPTDGRIGMVIEDMWITNPFESSCGRFIEVPSAYGIKMKDALDLWAHNQPIQAILDAAEEAEYETRQ